MKKIGSYSAKTDAALGSNNQLVGETDQVEILYNNNSGFEWSQTGCESSMAYYCKKKISVLLGCIMGLEFARPGKEFCFA